MLPVAALRTAHIGYHERLFPYHGQLVPADLAKRLGFILQSFAK